jgi:thiol-disulfide isomerase/thioredoxin
MKRSVRLVVALFAVQAALIGMYLLVGYQRTPEGSEGVTLGTAPPERMDAAMTPLVLRKRNGSRVDFRTPDRPTMIHFWATWCPPCRAELPGLLALPQGRPLDVVAIALDKEWADVDRFLNGLDSAGVLLGDYAEVERVFDVHTLPVTFFIEAGGRLRLRFDGARDWTDSAFVDTWIDGE